MSFAAIDIALLQSERAASVFISSGSGTYATPACPVCKQLDEQPHAPGCSMDAALSERGWCTREERDAARARIKAGSEPTLPPPSAT